MSKGRGLGALEFYLVGIGLPILVVAANGLVRSACGMPQSTAADLILALVIFDAVVAIQADDFMQFVRPEPLRENLVAIYVLLIIFNMFAWAFAALKVEKDLFKKHSKSQAKYLSRPVGLMLYAWTAPAVVMVLNLICFAYPA